jgi:hypothetical protein
MNPLIYPHGLEELGAYIYAMLCKNLLEEGNSEFLAAGYQTVFLEVHIILQHNGKFLVFIYKIFNLQDAIHSNVIKFYF